MTTITRKPIHTLLVEGGWVLLDTTVNPRQSAPLSVTDSVTARFAFTVWLDVLHDLTHGGWGTSTAAEVVIADLVVWGTDVDHLDGPQVTYCPEVAPFTDDATAELAAYFDAQEGEAEDDDEEGEAEDDDEEGEAEDDDEPYGRCPACGQPIDYCQGHGPLGDPGLASVLASHDDGDHRFCHDEGCEFATAHRDAAEVAEAWPLTWPPQGPNTDPGSEPVSQDATAWVVLYDAGDGAATPGGVFPADRLDDAVAWAMATAADLNILTSPDPDATIDTPYHVSDFEDCWVMVQASYLR